MQSGWFSFVILKDFSAVGLIIVVQRALAAPGGENKSNYSALFFLTLLSSFPLIDSCWYQEVSSCLCMITFAG